MWHVEPSFITEIDGKERIFGTVLYEEYGNDEIRMNMWSAVVEEE